MRKLTKEECISVWTKVPRKGLMYAITPLMDKMLEVNAEEEKRLNLENTVLRNEAEQLKSDVVNLRQTLGMAQIAISVSQHEASMCRFLKDHHAKSILGACFFFHSTDDGKRDFDIVISEAMKEVSKTPGTP